MATEEDRENGIDLWARIFKSKTWEDLKMIAEKDKAVDQAASSIWFLSEDYRIREQMWRRDLNEARYQARERAFKKLEGENANLKDEVAELRHQLELLRKNS